MVDLVLELCQLLVDVILALVGHDLRHGGADGAGRHPRRQEPGGGHAQDGVQLLLEGVDVAVGVVVAVVVGTQRQHRDRAERNGR